MSKLTGCATFKNGLVVRDEDVYKLIKQHSNLIDRLDGRKMVEMTFNAFGMLNGSIQLPKGKAWKFYKHKLF